MGCDIHLYKEKRVSNAWVTADKWEPSEYDEGRIRVPYKDQFNVRNYNLFGFLARGVRREHVYGFIQRGLPFDCSEQVNSEADYWGRDGHSHSYLGLNELKYTWEWLQKQKVRVSGMKDKAGLQRLMDSINGPESTDWNLIYPFCQWTTDKNCVEFEFDIPASYALSGVKDIIDLFDGIDGDDHRIVFWFDN